MHTQVLGAHSVSQLEKDDIEGVPSFDARLGAVLMHAKLSALQHYRRTRSVRFAALSLDARSPRCGPPVFVGPYTGAELVASLKLLKVPARELKRALEEAAAVRADPPPTRRTASSGSRSL